MEGTKKRYLFHQKCYIKGLGLDFGADPVWIIATEKFRFVKCWKTNPYRMKVLSKRVHLNDNTTEFFLQTQTVETKTWPLWSLISFAFYILLGGIFFSLISESSVWRNGKINWRRWKWKEFGKLLQKENCQWTTMIRQTRLCLSSCEKYWQQSFKM